MKILVVGGGAREHALVWRLRQEPGVANVICAPGNAGTGVDANRPVDVSDPSVILALAEDESVDLTVVGPELPLALGVRDLFAARGRLLFGPSRVAAQLESSKAFAKDFMARHGVPTARFRVCDTVGDALDAVSGQEFGFPVVVKADGLAAGKGVTVAPDRATAERAIRDAMVEGRFGSAGRRVVIEECLVGPEVSFFAICDGRQALALPTAQDHKRAFDGDTGPNTGGMGAFSPSALVTPDIDALIKREIVEPVLEGFAAQGDPYHGFLYVGLMLTPDGPRVIEFNVRLGDPEAQVVLPMVSGDLAPAFEAAARGALGTGPLAQTHDPHVGVVLASGGYPGAYATGAPIDGLETAAALDDVLIFHAGTAVRDGAIVTTGGRVLTVVGRGADVRPTRPRRASPSRASRCVRTLVRRPYSRARIQDMSDLQVQILMGSGSDAGVMANTVRTLRELGITCDITVASAHRSPDRVRRVMEEAVTRGVKVFVVGAGAAAHLAGVVAAHTALPVIGVPIDSSPLGGFDALLATVQMPPGIPVATVAVGKAGATNAAVLAAQILAVGDPAVGTRLDDYRRGLTEKVERAAAELEMPA